GRIAVGEGRQRQAGAEHRKTTEQAPPTGSGGGAPHVPGSCCAAGSAAGAAIALELATAGCIAPTILARPSGAAPTTASATTARASRSRAARRAATAGGPLAGTGAGFARMLRLGLGLAGPAGIAFDLDLRDRLSKHAFDRDEQLALFGLDQRDGGAGAAGAAG